MSLPSRESYRNGKGLEVSELTTLRKMESPAFYETQIFIKALVPILSQMHSVHNFPPHSLQNETDANILQGVA